MNYQSLYPNLRISEIFLPTDFDEAGASAFAHALKLALASKSRLTMLNVDEKSDGDWHGFPGVRETLERWKLIPPNSPKQAVIELGIDVRKIVLNDTDPVRACTKYLEINDAQLIVLSISQRQGIVRWLGRSVGEPIAANAKQMTLFVPQGVKGFVCVDDGSVDLKNILIPIAAKPDHQPAIEAVVRLIEGLQLTSGTVTLLYVGKSEDRPETSFPSGTGWTWDELVIDGDPVQVILKAADKLNADLIVMTTDGPDGFLDGLRGTTSERVLRNAKCPVGNLPVGSFLS